MCRSFKRVNRNKAGTGGLDRVREAARKDGDLKFTALLHHADVDALRHSFFKLKKKAAVGIDGVTWHDYERGLEVNLADLHDRIHRGSYRAKPSLRRYIFTMSSIYGYNGGAKVAAAEI